jgi:hypothetical protein
MDWLGRERVVQAAADGLQRNWAAYGRCPSGGDLQRVLEAWILEDRVDFGRLDEPLQEAVLRRLVRSRAQAALLDPASLPATDALRLPLARNRHVLQSRYTLGRYGEAVEAVYRQVADSTVTPLDNLDGEVLLDHFLAPERLALLRVD